MIQRAKAKKNIAMRKIERWLSSLSETNTVICKKKKKNRNKGKQLDHLFILESGRKIKQLLNGPHKDIYSIYRRRRKGGGMGVN